MRAGEWGGVLFIAVSSVCCLLVFHEGLAGIPWVFLQPAQCLYLLSGIPASKVPAGISQTQEEMNFQRQS
jgi:hypothetical protein